MKGIKPALFMCLIAAIGATGCQNSAERETESLLDGNPAGRLVDEVMPHVVDECDLYRTYQKNRIDFDPIEVGVSILPEMRRSRTDWQSLRNSIRDTVQYEESFYRRALMYNAY